MGNIGPERRRIEVLPLRDPPPERERPAPAHAEPPPQPVEPAREPAPVK